MALQSTSQHIQTEYNSRSEAWLAEHAQDRAWTDLAVKKPLELLDLPLDVLQAILKEVTHTNDLTALALTHSALHNLVIPHIYSRFDIVWPEANPTVESRVGVDALTYGLATLVMAHDVFGENPYQRRKRTTGNQRLRSIRRGNWFALHTKKFSLGNGPADWVSEYLITKEGGKMLGTLVALAVGRMRNLEAFIWDMPTGVLRDVWLALASLDDRDDGLPCKLEKLWVRWHDNRDAAPLPSPHPPGSQTLPHTNLPSLLQGSTSGLFQIPSYPSVTFPTFSILPPLKSISVLDIDEVPYAEELGILIERSLERLQELRIGVAAHAQRDLPFRPVEDRSVVPPPSFMSTDEQGQARPGGILGILVSQFCPIFSTVTATASAISHHAPAGLPSDHPEESRNATTKNNETTSSADHTDINQLGILLSAQSLQDDPQELEAQSENTGHEANPQPQAESPSRQSSKSSLGFENALQDPQHRRLQVSTLELEKVFLSIPVLSRAVDWSRLESLTLLGCMNHEQLWKSLRKQFTPAAVRHRLSISKTTSLLGRPRASSSAYLLPDPSEYKLHIRKLHTNTVSKTLLMFIKDTLAPDTLEWLFLQESTSYKSTVTIDDIYRLAIRRHRASLKKLLIDSELTHGAVRLEREREREPPDTNWRKWVCHRELINCITSGKMQLRELSISIDYKDWHFFLQRLPDAVSLRSLHIPRIAEHPSGRQNDPREVALQVLDIISLRSELQLCYLGVEKKCFEILEYKPTNSRRSSLTPGHNMIGVTTHTQIEDEDEDDETTAQGPGHGDMASDEEESWDTNSEGFSNFDGDDESESDSDADGNGRSSRSQKPAFRLREILFYDDKISIFKARHGKL